MLNKTLFCSIFALSAIFLVFQGTSLEARCHHRGSRVQVGVGLGTVVAPEAYVARRYVRPVQTQVYVATPGPYYGAVYVPQAPAPVPVYVEEEVYVVRPYRPVGIGFGGLSFSWNFFR